MKLYFDIYRNQKSNRFRICAYGLGRSGFNLKPLLYIVKSNKIVQTKIYHDIYDKSGLETFKSVRECIGIIKSFIVETKRRKYKPIDHWDGFVYIEVVKKDLVPQAQQWMEK